MRLNILTPAMAALCVCVLLPTYSDAAGDEKADVEKSVAQAIRPVMEHYGIPGIAVGIALNGQSYVFDYGVASKATGKPVDRDPCLLRAGRRPTLALRPREQIPPLPARQQLR